MNFFKTFEAFISNTTTGSGVEIDYQQGPNWRTLIGAKSKKLKIALYFDIGVKSETVNVWELFFSRYFSSYMKTLDSTEVRFEILEKYDLIIIPGGNSFKESLGLNQQSKQDLIKYVEEGGKILGVCAGAHLLSSSHSWSLNLIPVKHIDRQDELSTEIEYLDFEITQYGKQVFNTSTDSVRLYYHGGPVFKKTAGENQVKVLLKFKDPVPGQNDTDQSFTQGAIAAMACTRGRGKVIAISPHIEKSHPEDGLLANAINCLTEKRWFEVF